MVRPGTKSPEKMDGTKKGAAAVALVIAVMVTETTWLQNIHLKEKIKDSLISKLTTTKLGIDPLNSRRLLTLFLYYAQIRTSKASMRSFRPDMT